MFAFSLLTRVVDSLAKSQEKPTVHKLLFLGSHESGKTTLVDRIVKDERHIAVVKKGKLFTKIQIDATQFLLVDEQRGKQIQHFPTTSAVILVVDTTDSDSIEESRLIIEQIEQNKDLKDRPILIFGNKSDMLLALNETQLRQRLKIEKEYTDSNKIEVFMTSGIKGQGYLQGLRWLTIALKYQDDREDLQTQRVNIRVGRQNGAKRRNDSIKDKQE